MIFAGKTRGRWRQTLRHRTAEVRQAKEYPARHNALSPTHQWRTWYEMDMVMGVSVMFEGHPRLPTSGTGRWRRRMCGEIAWRDPRLRRGGGKWSRAYINITPSRPALESNLAHGKDRILASPLAHGTARRAIWPVPAVRGKLFQSRCLSGNSKIACPRILPRRPQSPSCQTQALQPRSACLIDGVCKQMIWTRSVKSGIPKNARSSLPFSSG